MKHRTRLFSGKPGTRYYAARFATQTLFWNPVVEESKLTNELQYGPLTAYLLRRFGYPNAGWDDHKELVKYQLTTAHPGMFMEITPSPSNVTKLSVGFMLEKSEWHQAEAFNSRHAHHWQKEALDRAEQAGLPAWVPEWEAYCNGEILPALQIEPGKSWRELGGYAHFDQAEIAKKAVAFYKQLYDDHRKLFPPPDYLGRPDKIAEWEADDPLKPVALAAVEALNDLLTPVMLRDHEINALGEVEFTGRGRKGAAVSGFPSGALGNRDPRGFAELHGLIVELGAGDTRRGIARATKLIKESGPRRQVAT